MKNIYIFLLILIFSNSVTAQIINDYPFKSFLDTSNNLHITGSGFFSGSNSIDILYEKYTSSGTRIHKKYYSFSGGNDRGMDIVVDDLGNAFLTGFIYNSASSSNDIITIMFDKFANQVWDSIFINPGDDKGFGIDISTLQNNVVSGIYISGYSTDNKGQKIMFIRKYGIDQESSWQRELNLSDKYSIATDIFVDAGYVYVSGYSYQGPAYGDDITLVTLDKASGTIEPGDILFHNIAESNERPTSFSLVNRSESVLSKSRSVITSISESFNQNPNIQNDNYSSFLTSFYNEDVNNNISVKWTQKFSNKRYGNVNIPTCITTDLNENVYVTGYTYSGIPGHDLDFVSMKLSQLNGSYMWPNQVEYYNNDLLSSPTYDDKASSIKLGKNNEFFVAGTSDASPYGYSVVSYKNDMQGGTPIVKWTKTFRTDFEFSNGPEDDVSERAATLEVDSEGQPILIVMEWNANCAEWKAIKYDTDGNILYTIGEEDNSDENLRTDPKSNLSKFIKSDTEISNTQLFQNKPNPFNPSTEIFYNVSQNSFINIKVYNLLGQEVAALVNEMKQPGNYQIRFDGSALSSGMYFYKMFVNEIATGSKRMLLLK